MKNQFSLIEDRLRAFWSRLARNVEVSARALSAFRVAYAVSALLFFLPSFGWLSEAPSALYSPPLLSVAWFFDGFPSAGFTLFLDCAFPVLLICVLLGVQTSAALLAYVILNISGNLFAYSFGKIDHTILYTILPGFLALTPCDEYYALRRSWRPYRGPSGLPLAIYACCLAFGMMSAGLPKAKVWLDFDLSTSGFLSWFYSGYFQLDRVHYLAPYVFDLPVAIWEIGDVTAILFEVTGFLFLWAGRKSWRAYLLFAMVFHLLNTLLLNIPFLNHSLVYTIFLAHYLTVPALARSINFFQAAGVLLAVTQLGLIFFSDRGLLLASDSTEIINLHLAVAVVVWPAMIIATLIGSGVRRPEEVSHSEAKPLPARH